MHPPGVADRATGRETRGIDDSDAHAAQLRAAIADMVTEDAATCRRMTREMREPGSPAALETVPETATTPRGKDFDSAASDGRGSVYFRELLTAAQCHQVEFSFDWMIADGLLKPAAMVRIAAELARGFSHLHADTQEGREAQGLVNLLEQYPTQAMAYAAERVATFDKRYGGPR